MMAGAKTPKAACTKPAIIAQRGYKPLVSRTAFAWMQRAQHGERMGSLLLGGVEIRVGDAQAGWLWARVMTRCGGDCHQQFVLNERMQVKFLADGEHVFVSLLVLDLGGRLIRREAKPAINLQARIHRRQAALANQGQRDVNTQVQPRLCDAQWACALLAYGPPLNDETRRRCFGVSPQARIL